MKTDFFRLLAVHFYGGFYFDMDVRISKSLDSLLESNSLIFPFEWTMHNEYFQKRYNFTFNTNKHSLDQIGNYAFASARNNNFFIDVIDNIIINYPYNKLYISDNDVLALTGPDILNITYWECSKKYNFEILKGCDNTPYKSREWGSNTWHKFGKYGEHLLNNSWKENKDSYYYNYVESLESFSIYTNNLT